jgi:hypothetical protein
VAVALLVGGANIDFATPPRHKNPGYTPLIYAAASNHAGIVKMLLKRGADGTKQITKAAHGHDAGSTALDIVRLQPTGTPTLRRRLRCCACGAAARPTACPR